MKTWTNTFLALGALLSAALPAAAQNFPTDDPVIEPMWAEGMEDSQAWAIGQAMLDSIGPRLTGTPAVDLANQWAETMLSGWGVDARVEEYGTWKGWERGVTHVDLLEPRVRTLDAMLMAWSPASDGTVEGGVATFPDASDRAAFDAWLTSVEGHFVALAMPQPSCRPTSSYEEHGTEVQAEAVREKRREMRLAWNQRMEAIGLEPAEMIAAIEDAGALGILWSDWTGAWGSRRIFALNTRFGAATTRIPAVDLSCEDYGLVWRLAARDQGPVLRVTADATMMDEVPVANVIGEIRGTELPDEYVVLSAHYDSWDGGSGATDNGTGSIVMMEAMRILSEVYPNPRRTILVGLWASEEQGLNGSRAFVADHPEVIEGLQAAFNQDNGTGQIARASAMGLVSASGNIAGWMSQLPRDISGKVDLTFPGSPSGGGSDHAAFNCTGAPTVGLGSSSWDYFSYTWHTNLDTFDKIVWENVRNNATLVAMLAYLASEDERVSRDVRATVINRRTGEPAEWPACEDGARETNARYR